MNAQIIVLAGGAEESSVNSNTDKEVLLLSPEMLNVVGGGEGMICIG